MTRSAATRLGMVLGPYLAVLAACGGGSSVAPTPAASPSQPPTVATPPPSPRPPLAVDQFLASCPTADEIRSVDADLLLVFDADPTREEPPACTASNGSADLTLFEKRVYQALLVMRYLQFDAPLPWTSLPLYDWLRATVSGIRFRSDVANSFCCEGGGLIVIATAASRSEDRSCLLAGGTPRWVSANFPCGMDAFIAIVAHEARHNERKPHTCNPNDRTIDELGAWAVNYYMFRWFSEHTGSQLTPIDGRPSESYYRDRARDNARAICSRFCEQACPGDFSLGTSAAYHRPVAVEMRGCSAE